MGSFFASSCWVSFFLDLVTEPGGADPTPEPIPTPMHNFFPVDLHKGPQREQLSLFSTHSSFPY